MNQTAVHKLEELFDRDISEGGRHFGAQLAVYSHGKLIWQRFGGYLGPGRPDKVTAHTPFMIFSVSKSIIASAIHRLAGQGLLDPSAPVCRYWPAFSGAGRELVTINELLSHTAGLQKPGNLMDVLSWLSGRSMAARVRRMRTDPSQRGRCVYHSFSAHIILGEVISQVARKPVQDYLRDEFFIPLQLNDTSPGLPPALFKSSAGIHSADPAQMTPVRVFSLPLLRKIFLPAASINTTAVDLGRFYAMLAQGGTLDGQSYLDPSVLAKALEPAWDGSDGFSDRHIVWSHGWTLGGYSTWPDKDVRLFGVDATRRCFGHAGQGGCALAWADPDSHLAMAFVNNCFLELEASQRRSQEYSDAVRAAFT